MDTSASLSAGHLIVEELEAHGVRRTYLVPGESYLDVIDGLHDSSITPIVCRQEGGAAYMAVAEGRMTGVPGIAMVTRGPGAANVMVGVHTAYQDATPLVVFVGLVPIDHRGRESFQEFDLDGWFSTTTKKVLTLDDPDKAAEVVVDAMHTAVAGRPGPVVIGLPEEVLVRPSAATVLPPRVLGSASPYAGDLTELRARITAADRPVLIIGGEDWSPSTAKRIAQWSRDRGLGVLGTFRAYDGIDHDSPNFLGILGYGAAPVAKRVLDEADLHIFLGCVRTDVATAGFTLGTDQRTVVIGPDPDARGHFGRLDQHIVTSVSRFAQALFTEDGSRTYSVSSDGSIDEPPLGDALSEAAGEAVPLPDWVSEARAELDDWRLPQVASAGSASAGSSDGVVDMDEAFVHVRQLLPDDAIITYGAGNFSGWATRFLPAHGFPSALGPRNGSMGFGLPAAVAAGLVHPERSVFCITGDGDFLMNGQEMATAAQYGLDITVVVNDNSVYGTIRGHQDREYPGRATATALENPDFAAMAQAFGGLGIRVERTADFRDAFERALAHKGLSLVHCLTDPSIRGARLPNRPD
jgi:acetolactate synthase-1/2/3 large subunit